MDTSFFARRPLSALSIFGIVVMVLGGIGALFGGIVGVGWPGGVSLDVSGSVFLIGAALIGSGWRWGPIVGAVITGGAFCYALFVNPYPSYHFAHAQDGFPIFFGVLMAVVSMAVATVTNATAAVQNYRAAGPRSTPRWLYNVFAGAVCFVVGAAIFASIAQPPTSAATDVGLPTVHLKLSQFSPTSISIPVGSQLRFTDDGSVPHILDYGLWNGERAGNIPAPAGAPALSDHQIAGGSFTIGPFTTAGTYHILCVVHPGMELTVTVAAASA